MSQEWFRGVMDFESGIPFNTLESEDWCYGWVAAHEAQSV